MVSPKDKNFNGHVPLPSMSGDMSGEMLTSEQIDTVIKGLSEFAVGKGGKISLEQMKDFKVPVNVLQQSKGIEGDKATILAYELSKVVNNTGKEASDMMPAKDLKKRFMDANDLSNLLHGAVNAVDANKDRKLSFEEAGNLKSVDPLLLAASANAKAKDNRVPSR